MASKVRAMTPAAMEEDRELSDGALLQLCCGPNVTCRGSDLFSFAILNSIHLLLLVNTIGHNTCLPRFLCVGIRIRVDILVSSHIKGIVHPKMKIQS